MTHKTVALIFKILVVLFPVSAITIVRAEQTSPPAPFVAKSSENDALAREITKLFSEDQAFLSDVQNAKKDPAFLQTYKSYVERVKEEDHNPNFYDSGVLSRWVQKA